MNPEKTPDHIMLTEPSKHPLPELLRALKWGRRATQQNFLLKLADAIEGGQLEGTLKDLIDDKENQDPSDWWKK